MESNPSTLSLAKLPYSALQDPTPETVEQLREICETHGFFVITDHPVPVELLRATSAAARGFFALPEALKSEYAHDKQVVTPQANRGYSPVYEEALSPQMGEDLKQLFDLGMERPLKPGVTFTGPTIMPNDEVAPGFASSLLGIQKVVVETMVPVVARGLALALGMDAGFFDESLNELVLNQRVVYYPARQGIARQHTDSGLFTLLFQETCKDKSLQVLTSGQWIPVEANERDVVVNLGDLLQFWTSGRFVSTPHKVDHAGGSSRVSLPFFVYPSIDSSFVPFGKRPEDKKAVADVLGENYSSIWVEKAGAGRAKELLQAS